MSEAEAAWKGNVSRTRIDDPTSPLYDPSWNPMSVPRRKASVVVRESYCGVPTWGEVVYGGVEACGSDIDLAEASQFTAGRYQDAAFNTALRHMNIVDGKPVLGPNGVLGAAFDQYFVERYSTLEQIQIITDYRNGFDMERHMTPEFLAATARKEEKRRECHARGERAPVDRARNHAPICSKRQFVVLLAATVMGYLGTGAVECLGLTCDVAGSDIDPLYRGTFTIEPSK